MQVPSISLGGTLQPVTTTIYKNGFADNWKETSWGCRDCSFADKDNVGQACCAANACCMGLAHSHHGAACLPPTPTPCMPLPPQARSTSTASINATVDAWGALVLETGKPFTSNK